MAHRAAYVDLGAARIQVRRLPMCILNLEISQRSWPGWQFNGSVERWNSCSLVRFLISV